MLHRLSRQAHSSELGAAEVASFLTHLAVNAIIYLISPQAQIRFATYSAEYSNQLLLTAKLFVNLPKYWFSLSRLADPSALAELGG